MRFILCILALILTLASQFGCGGSENSNQLGLDNSLSCDFQISSFMNGPNASEATSYWSCIEAGVSGILQVFTDGTGYNTANGAFTWSQTGCRSVSYNGGNASGEITEINGSTSSGILTAKDHVNGQINNASCVLQSITESSSSNNSISQPSATTNFIGTYIGTFTGQACDDDFPTNFLVYVTNSILENGVLKIFEGSQIEFQNINHNVIMTGLWININNPNAGTTIHHNGWNCIGSYGGALNAIYFSCSQGTGPACSISYFPN